MNRKCSKCGKLKPIEAFAKFEKGRDGRRAQCKECDRRYRIKRKKKPMPKEGDGYIVNSITMMNHFYLHFGFTDRRYNASEYADSVKYTIHYTITNNSKK